MAPRPIWKGHLRLALVSCPVALFNARHERNVLKFNLINPATGNRIKMVSQDAGTGLEVARRDTVKGYEYKKDHYLLMADDDFDSVKVETSSMMKVEKFVEASSIDPIYFDASYYVAPDGKGAEDVYVVLREAIRQTGMVALTRVVISQRERTIALRAIEGGLVAHTLNEERDLNSAKPLFEDVEQVKVDPEMVKLAVQLVDRQAGRYEPADLEDRYETRLRAMIDAKLKGEGFSTEPEPESDRTNVVDLMAVLKKSLADASAAEAASSPPEAKSKPAVTKRAKTPTPEEMRRQPTFKLPIEGGLNQKAPKQKTAAEPKVEQTSAEKRKVRRKA